jgi:MoxR-like ATPase
MLSKALARALDWSVRRIQFSPDLLPSEVTGVSVFNQETRQFEFRPGGIFANIVIGDEINRASPKTQSAMLECMEEGQVTVDGTTYELARPFLVVATQNPIEMEGTYALPEAQRDRFLARVSMGYPVPRAEIDMLAAREARSPLDDLAAVASATEVAAMIAAAARVHLSEPVQEYLVAISTATRNDASLRLGASPRATLHLARAARALAAMSGRDYVLPDDALALAPAVLTHRLVLTTDAQMAGRTVAEVLAAILERIPVPGTARAVAPPRR